MSDPRWITPDELIELIDRSYRLLRKAGYTIKGRPVFVTGQAEVGGIKITLTANGDVTLTDRVASVLVFDYDTKGIKECYGSTARNVLLELRENMVLDDLADV